MAMAMSSSICSHSNSVCAPVPVAVARLSLAHSTRITEKVCELRGDVHGETRRRSRMKTERRLQCAECYDGDGDEQLELLSQQLCLRASTCSRRALSLARVPLASQRNLRVAR